MIGAALCFLVQVAEEYEVYRGRYPAMGLESLDRSFSSSLRRTDWDWRLDTLLGELAEAQVKPEEVVEDEALARRVSPLLEQLTAVTGRAETVRVAIVKGESNAYSPGGGLMLVSDTLLAEIKKDGELTCILAHELAHAFASHGMRHLRFEFEMDRLESAKRISSEEREFAEALYSRLIETEADALGAYYLRRANVPRAALSHEAEGKRDAEVRKKVKEFFRGREPSIPKPFHESYEGYRSGPTERKYLDMVQMFEEYSRRLDLESWYSIRALSPIFDTHPASEIRQKTMRAVERLMAGEKLEEPHPIAEYVVAAMKSK